jgi:hypothetical protein
MKTHNSHLLTFSPLICHLALMLKGGQEGFRNNVLTFVRPLILTMVPRTSLFVRVNSFLRVKSSLSVQHSTMRPFPIPLSSAKTVFK